MKIPFNEVEVHPGTTGHGALLFFWKGELYRAPYALRQSRFKKLCDAPISLQPMERTNYTIDVPRITGLPYANNVYNLTVEAKRGLPVYRHKTYAHLVKIHETVPNRAKDFVSAICDINKYLLNRGFILVDIHADNIYDTIDGILWTDWGSIEKVGENKTENRAIALVIDLASRVLNWPDDPNDWYSKGLPIDPRLKEVSQRNPTDTKTWMGLKAIIDEINFTPPESHWSDQYGNWSDLDLSNGITAKELIKTSKKSAAIIGLLDKISYDTVTDIACNKGYFTVYAAKKAKSALGIDIDMGCIHKAIDKTKDLGLPLIFARKDIRTMCNNLGRLAHPAPMEKERSASDLVIAMAIVHHVKKFMEPKAFARGLAHLAKRHILIEDVDKSAPVYQKVFENKGFRLAERVTSWPEARTISLYTRA